MLVGWVELFPTWCVGWYGWRIADGGSSSLPNWACIHSFIDINRDNEMGLQAIPFTVKASAHVMKYGI